MLIPPGPVDVDHKPIYQTTLFVAVELVGQTFSSRIAVFHQVAYRRRVCVDWTLKIWCCGDEVQPECRCAAFVTGNPRRYHGHPCQDEASSYWYLVKLILGLIFSGAEHFDSKILQGQL